MKKLKPILGISLLVQSITFFVLFLVNCEKKKNLARVFAAFSAIGGIAGGCLLYSEYANRNKELEGFDDEGYFDEFDELFEDYDDDDDVEEDEILCTFDSNEDAE